jgi:hypothetical protein
MQPSGCLGLRTYALLMVRLQQLECSPSPSAASAIQAAGLRLVRVSGACGTRRTLACGKALLGWSTELLPSVQEESLSQALDQTREEFLALSAPESEGPDALTSAADISVAESLVQICNALVSTAAEK